MIVGFATFLDPDHDAHGAARLRRAGDRPSGLAGRRRPGGAAGGRSAAHHRGAATRPGPALGARGAGEGRRPGRFASGSGRARRATPHRARRISARMIEDCCCTERRLPARRAPLTVSDVALESRIIVRRQGKCPPCPVGCMLIGARSRVRGTMNRKSTIDHRKKLVHCGKAIRKRTMRCVKYLSTGAQNKQQLCHFGYFRRQFNKQYGFTVAKLWRADNRLCIVDAVSGKYGFL